MKKNHKYTSKYHIEKEIDVIMDMLYIVKQNWLLFKELKSKENIEAICSQFPHMFKIILNALQEKALLELAKLVVDLNKVETNSVTINDLYNHYQKNKKVFKVKKYFMVRDVDTGKRHRFYFDIRNIDASMKQLKDDLKASEKIINYLKKRRNKSLAHNDKKMSFDSRIKYSKGKITGPELEEFIDKLIKDINEISSCVFGKHYAFCYTEIEELNYIRDIFKKEKDNL